MNNFGIGSLRLVRPDSFDAHRITGIAHRSERLVKSITNHDSLADALADCTWAIGTSARPRSDGRNYARPRQAARWVAARVEDRVALVFGREDRGLKNDDLDHCQAVVVIPTSPEHPSLNLAQACLLVAYEIFLAVGDPHAPLPTGRRADRTPTHAELEATYEALERGLASIDFFKARRPRAVMRTLRTTIARARPDLREARLLAAVGHEIRHFVDRASADRGT